MSIRYACVRVCVHLRCCCCGCCRAALRCERIDKSDSLTSKPVSLISHTRCFKHMYVLCHHRHMDAMIVHTNTVIDAVDAAHNLALAPRHRGTAEKALCTTTNIVFGSPCGTHSNVMLFAATLGFDSLGALARATRARSARIVSFIFMTTLWD